MDADLVKVLEEKVKTLEKQLYLTTRNWHKSQMEKKTEIIEKIVKVENNERIKSLEQQLQATQASKRKYKEMVTRFTDVFGVECSEIQIIELNAKLQNVQTLEKENSLLKIKAQAVPRQAEKEIVTVVEEKIIYIEKEPKIIIKEKLVENLFHENECKQEMLRLRTLLEFYQKEYNIK
eukprot:NODE_721_length_4486_cov_1.005015.p3 type:complete len:178 gc:universal NODE_721_length_4486_cov_1.005015:280-813(+)